MGDIKEDWKSGDVPQKLKLFCETTHNICINIQQTTVILDKINLAAKYIFRNIFFTFNH